MNENHDDEVREQRRAALMESLALVAPEKVEEGFRDFFGAGSGAWNAWDERFVEFIARHRDAPLLAGRAGHEVFVVFSPKGGAGFWVLARADGSRGKGFLGPRDVDRLAQIAAQKGLV